MMELLLPNNDIISHILGKPVNAYEELLFPDDVLSVVSAHRKRYTTFWMDVFPKIVNIYRRTQSRSNTLTHFVVPTVNGNEIETNDVVKKLPKVNGRLLTIPNQSVEFPYFYDSTQVRVIKPKAKSSQSLVSLKCNIKPYFYFNQSIQLSCKSLSLEFSEIKLTEYIS